MKVERRGRKRKKKEGRREGSGRGTEKKTPLMIITSDLPFNKKQG